jgi:prepilin-type N-terminal cleavage/methylation domain-containing protein
MKCRRAFTLIELLVVVTIIVLLVAMLLPSLSTAVRISNQAVCASNLHQMGSLILSYTGDNFRAFPTIGGSTIEIYQYDAPTARRLLEPYGLQEKIAFCTDGFAPEQTMTSEYQSNNFAFWGYSYFPYRETRDGLDWGYVPGFNNTDNIVVNGSFSGDKFPLIADVTAGHNEVGWTPARPWFYTHANHPNYLRPEGIHLYTGQQMYIPYGLNNCYWDGHVAWINFDKLNLDKHYVHSHWKYNRHWE